MNKLIKEIAMPVILTAALVLPLSAQDIPGQVDRVKQDAPKVFFDCHQCDMDYIRTEITFVNFVRERKVSPMAVVDHWNSWVFNVGMNMNLLGQTMTMTLEINEPWGNISSSLQGSNYFHDLGKNRLEFWGGLNLQLWKGLPLRLYGQYSRINDQISLSKAGVSLEDILLQKKMLATNYNYGFSVGVSYTFGSIYSNIVNPRFGR